MFFTPRTMQIFLINLNQYKYTNNVMKSVKKI